MVGFAALTLWFGGAGAWAYAAIFAACGVVAGRLLPWRFVVVDDGLALWFALRGPCFLARDAVVVRAGVGSAVAIPIHTRHMGYPLTDGLLERRRLLLRAVLVEHGFRVA
jgi:hypothetical protein